MEEGCWLAPGAPRKEPESGWTLAAREEGLENAGGRVLGRYSLDKVLRGLGGRTGVVELEVVFLEVGMAKVALFLC